MDSVNFFVPRIPPSPNKLHGQNWRMRFREKHTWIVELQVGAGREKIQQLREWHEVSRLRVEMIIHHSRLFDPDNLVSCAKVPLDAAKWLGFITDDSSKWIELHVSQVKSSRKEARTEFRLSRIA